MTLTMRMEVTRSAAAACKSVTRWRDALALFLLFVIVAIALGLVGFVIKGLLFLFVIGVIVLAIDLVALGFRGGRGRRRLVR